MNTPEVSVISSAYNEEHELPRSIESILNQSFQDFEFIIVDDGSTDATLTILKEYSKKDKRIKVISNSQNLGLTKSLNKAISVAKGRYIARQDACDVSLPKRFKKQIKYLRKNKDVILLGTSAYIIDDSGEVIATDIVLKRDREIRKVILRRNPVYHGSIVFRKKAIEPIGFYREKFRYAQDLDLYLRILEIGKINNLQEPLYAKRIHVSSAKSFSARRKFGEMARKFAKERMEYGHDSYPSLNEAEILSRKTKIDPETRYQFDRCSLMTIGGDPKKARREIRSFIKERTIPLDLLLKLLIFYILTLLSKRNFNLFKEIRKICPLFF